MVPIWPKIIKLFLTGFWPTHVRIIKSAIKSQKQNLKIDLKVVLRTSDVLVNGIIKRTKIAPTIATIPPALWGTLLKIA